jgi:hypothetical protein
MFISGRIRTVLEILHFGKKIGEEGEDNLELLNYYMRNL